MSFQKEQYYQCRSRLVASKHYTEMIKIIRRFFKMIQHKTKRRPYVRSAYFSKEKIFFDYFWSHLKDKHHSDRVRRLRFFECAIELIQESRIKPVLKIEDKYLKEKLYRFWGNARGEIFAVQIKEDLKRKQKFLVSIFPLKK